MANVRYPARAMRSVWRRMTSSTPKISCMRTTPGHGPSPLDDEITAQGERTLSSDRRGAEVYLRHARYRIASSVGAADTVLESGGARWAPIR